MGSINKRNFLTSLATISFSRCILFYESVTYRIETTKFLSLLNFMCPPGIAFLSGANILFRPSLSCLWVRPSFVPHCNTSFLSLPFLCLVSDCDFSFRGYACCRVNWFHHFTYTAVVIFRANVVKGGCSPTHQTYNAAKPLKPKWHVSLLAFNQDICFPQWQCILLDWDILHSSSIEHFGLKEDAGVLVLDAGQQQPLCLNWAPWNYDLLKQKCEGHKKWQIMSPLASQYKELPADLDGHAACMETQLETRRAQTKWKSVQQ